MNEETTDIVIQEDAQQLSEAELEQVAGGTGVVLKLGGQIQDPVGGVKTGPVFTGTVGLEISFGK